MRKQKYLAENWLLFECSIFRPFLPSWHPPEIYKSTGEGDGKVKEEEGNDLSLDNLESDYGLPDQEDHVKEKRRRFKRTRKKLQEKKIIRDQGGDSTDPGQFLGYFLGQFWASVKT